MNKKASAAQLGGATMSAPEVIPASPPSSGLEPYNGPWGWQQAAHLLRRATFGPTYEEIDWAVQNGRSGTVAKLFEDRPLPDPPVNYQDEDDPNVPIGETWVDAPYVSFTDLEPGRADSLDAWTIMQFYESGLSVREKMTFFWHNHFGVANSEDPKFVYRYFNLLQSMALGNFRDLVKEVTIDPHMLRFLNGNQNTKKAPNENYARELFELYTVGKGPQIGPGDYTYYTEADILEVSKILTGWKDLNYKTRNAAGLVESRFIAADHDTSLKTLSDKFNNATFQNEGELSYSALIDLIFQHPKAAHHVCRKLYRWFVYYLIDEQVETLIIDPMAQMLRDNNFEIKPVLEALLSSAHFFDILSLGPMIKNPVDALLSLYRPLKMVPEITEVSLKYRLFREIESEIEKQGFKFFNPPEVAGWKAWYQSPVYYRHWINTQTIRTRNLLHQQAVDRGIELEDQQFEADLLALLNGITVPSDPNVVVEYFADLLLPMPLTGEKVDGSFENGQYKFLKEQLIPGLPDFEWTIEYQNYLADPENPDLANLIIDKLKKLVGAIARLAEFHLS